MGKYNGVHPIVTKAIRSGKLKRKPCEICRSKRSDAHHRDYSKPLEVVWLCRKHHFEEHARLRKAKRDAEARDYAEAHLPTLPPVLIIAPRKVKIEYRRMIGLSLST